MAITGIDTIEGKQIIAAGAVSAKSAEMAYKDENGNPITGYQVAGDYYSASNPSGFITGVDLTPYQLTADMTGYLTTGDSANFYTTANESGFLTGLPIDISVRDLNASRHVRATVTGQDIYGNFDFAGMYFRSGSQRPYNIGIDNTGSNFYIATAKNGFERIYASSIQSWNSKGDMFESAFSYDASNNITAYNGSAFKAGDEFPQSATEAIETVTANSADWNGTTETVSSNSGAWGGSALPISAGQGIKLEMINNTLVISPDETVLWSGNGNTASAFNMSENPFNFQKLKFIPSVNSTAAVSQSVEVELTDTDKVALLLQMPRADIWSNIHELYSIDTTGMTLLNCNYTWGAWGSTTSTTNTATLTTRIGTVIGINRISGGN